MGFFDSLPGNQRTHLAFIDRGKGSLLDWEYQSHDRLLVRQ
jgi:hypothetical protein